MINKSVTLELEEVRNWFNEGLKTKQEVMELQGKILISTIKIMNIPSDIQEDLKLIFSAVPELMQLDEKHQY